MSADDERPQWPRRPKLRKRNSGQERKRKPVTSKPVKTGFFKLVGREIEPKPDVIVDFARAFEETIDDAMGTTNPEIREAAIRDLIDIGRMRPPRRRD